MLNRRVIYFAVMLAVGIPIYFGYEVPPARMQAAEKLYDIIENYDVKDGEIALVALDFGPNTKAENQPQAEVVLEHLLRKRIPFALVTQYALAEGFLADIPETIVNRLQQEMPDEHWEYGVDWVNLGFQTGSSLFVQSVAKSKDLIGTFVQDVNGTPLGDLDVFDGVKTIKNMPLLLEFTGLVGVFDTYVQFFQSEGYVPIFGHGCTSITIPEAYIYLDSGQLSGLLEGIAGAAWYSKLLSEAYPERSAGMEHINNTALGVAHIVIILFILLGNVLAFTEKRSSDD